MKLDWRPDMKQAFKKAKARTGYQRQGVEQAVCGLLQGQGDPCGALWCGEDPHTWAPFLPRVCGSGGPSPGQQGWINLPADNY